MPDRKHALVAVLACLSVPRTRAFYERLGFSQHAGDDEYSMLSDPSGAELHLQPADPELLVPGSNHAGVYLYTEAVDDLASRFPGEILGGVQSPESKPWGMYEFALSDPDGALVRIGWPTRLRT